ncbi:ATP-grasp domain-containing protein [Streptomyces sp. NPDC087263]|uniref:ATP-grasp domain-containing protein n=1 Tax=Streptomyces sp. NPDC087263 TaxID=3365773 RepID=UPI0037F5FEE1
MTIAALEALTFGLGRLIEAADNAGHRLCLLTGNRDVYRHELAHLDPTALDIVDLDTTDEAACAAALAAVPDLRGLINSTDTWSVPGADLAAKLGLPGPDPTAVRQLRDKSRVRNLLHERGLSRGGALAVPVDPSSAAVEILREVGLPAILKDSAGTSSRNVWPVRDEHQLHTALTEAAQRPFNGRLFAEPFFSGPVYSAETLSWENETKLLGVLSRQMSPEPSVREEAAAFPVALPRPELDLIQDWVARVLAIAGHDSGFAHVEFVLTTEGPELVEINRRIGGALVGEALCRALGTNVYDAMVDTALGRRPALLDTVAVDDTPGPATAFVLVYPDRPGTLTGWTGLGGLSAFPGSPEWYPTAVPGRRVEHLSDQRSCTGIVLAEAATAELALHRALSAAGSVRPVIATDDDDRG